ncbi:hypothetical protein KCU72_g72, partial [Aureobasidium melanogenum]
MNTLEPFLHNRIQTTRLIEVYIVDRGHNRGIVKAPNGIAMVCLVRYSVFLGSKVREAGLMGMVHASMSVIRKYAETMSMCSRLWAGTQNMRCTSWNQLMLAAWPVSVSLFISISHQRSELDTYGPDAGMISAFESSRNMCKIAYPISPETCRVAVLRLLAGGGRRSSLTFNA